MLLADQPTGNLDGGAAVEIMAVLQALTDEGLTIVLVTHELDIARFAQPMLGFRDGRIGMDAPEALLMRRLVRAVLRRTDRAGAVPRPR